LNQNLADSGIPLRFIPKAGRSRHVDAAPAASGPICDAGCGTGASAGAIAPSPVGRGGGSGGCCPIAAPPCAATINASRPSARSGLAPFIWAVQLDPATKVAGGGASGGNVSGTSSGAGSLMTSGPGAGMSGGAPGVGASSGVGGRTGFGIVSGGGVGTGFGGSPGIRRLRGLRSQSNASPSRFVPEPALWHSSGRGKR
jgi:hypothetical protein